MKMLAAMAAVALASCSLHAADCVEVASVPGEAPSLLPAGRKLRLVWNDEFRGTELDTSKWTYRTNFWGRRATWFAAPEDRAVEVTNGVARLMIVERNGQLKSPQLQTAGLLWDIPQVDTGFWPFPKRDAPRYLKRYGYFECRCRLQQLPGWWSAFWMQAEANGATLSPGTSGIEHDIMESFVPGKVIPAWFHYNGYGSDYVGFSATRTPPSENARLSTSLDKTVFHTFGMLWEPDGYTVYIDGRQSGFKVGTGPKEAVSHVPEFILVSTEVKGCRKATDIDPTYGCARPTPESFETAKKGDDFLVDYVRVYDLTL